MRMGDRLRNPIDEQEFLEIIMRNLQTELRHELLHFNIQSVSALRAAVRKHEKFQEDLRQWPNRTSAGVRRQISEVDVNIREEIEAEEAIDVVDSKSLKCWNCDALGHRYQSCLAPRRIFCYGCGCLNTYKPNCTNCLNRAQNLNLVADVRRPKSSHPFKK